MFANLAELVLSGGSDKLQHLGDAASEGFVFLLGGAALDYLVGAQVAHDFVMGILAEFDAAEKLQAGVTKFAWG